MAGRKRKPDHLKVVSGTAQPCRMNKDAPAAISDLPEAPEWLSDRAAEIFLQIVGIIDAMQIASASDVKMLALLASRLEEVEVTTAVIEDLGRTYTTVNQTGSVMYRSRPEVAHRNEAMRHAQSLLAEFGLSPAARSKVSVNGDKDENPFKALG